MKTGIKRLHPLLPSLTLPVLSVVHSLALGDTAVTELDFFEDLSAVNSVSGFEQRIEQAPASVTVIDRHLIEISGAQTFVDIFRLVPGFQAYYVSGNRYGIGYHDIGKESPNQLEVMIDGRFVFDALFSSVNWGTLGIELSDIDRIEIVRGSNAAALGSSAFRNAINIITRKPAQDRGLEIHTTVGDLQTRNVTIRYGNTLGALDYRLTLGHRENEGFPAVEEGPMDDGQDLSLANFRGTYTPTLLDTFDFALGYTRDHVGWGDADHPDEFSRARSYSHFESIKWLRSPNTDNDFSLHLYHNKFKVSNHENLGPLYSWLDLDQASADFLQNLAATSPVTAVNLIRGLNTDFPPNLTDNSILQLINGLDTPLVGGLGTLESERLDLQFQHNFRVNTQLQGAWGLGARTESISRYRRQTYDIEVDEQSYRIFAHAEWWPTKSLVLNNGVMVEKTFIGTLASPRVAANYLIDKSNTVRLAYTRGHRSPSLLEANERNIGTVNGIAYDLFRVGDPDLGEEQVDTTEFGYLFQHPHSGLTLDVRVFHEHVRDIIDEQLIPAPDMYQSIDDNLKIITNGGFWQINGAELQLVYQYSPNTLLRLHYMNVDLDRHTLPRLDRTLANPDAYIRSKEDRMAKHSGGILLHHKFSSSWSVSVSTYFQSDVTWEDGNRIEDFVRTDAQLAYQFRAGRSSGSLRLVAQNLGKDYEEFIDNNHFETRIFLVAQIDLPQ